jgi:ATP-binding cassette, subfamily B, bacterial PglK
MLRPLRQLQSLFTPRERRNGWIVLAMTLGAGPLEAAGVASIGPILAVLVNPAIVQKSALLASVYRKLEFSDVNAFLIFLVLVSFALIMSRVAFSALTQYVILRYTNGLSYSLSVRLLETYLQRPYVWFLNRHSVDLGKGILSELDEVINGTLVPVSQLFSSIAVVLFLVAALCVVNPVVAASVIFVLGGGYVAVYWGLQSYFDKIGRERFDANRDRYQVAIEVLAGIKDVKVNGLEAAYLERFRAPADLLARRRATAKIVSLLPRYAFEMVAYAGLLSVLLVLLESSGASPASIVPILGIYALAGLRLLPALQQIFMNLARVKFTQAALDNLYNDLTTASEPKPLPKPRDVVARTLNDCLELRSLTYSYPCTQRPALANISLRISARTTVGFVGATGAGKSTLVDVILGLLEPQHGGVLVDGTPISGDNLRAWQRAIGYVPQQIFLADDTIAANIAFGVAPSKIDMQAVERAAKHAELHAFVLEALPDGYQTKIGERGVRLSGGQRQRVGIARALYRDPDVLIFDEATSALDNLTEKAVMDAIRNLAHAKTMLVIAHRLSTVRSCDQIFLLDRGQLKATGTFVELLSQEASFQQLAMAGQ